ncbi:MAG: pentapeptide repeat-containing protein [Gallionella sp.]|nr:pentapeptide repeat-containing protein [Gallionella sp.]
MENFEAGADAFLAWQESWQDLAEQNKRLAYFDTQHVFNENPDNSLFVGKSHCLDFVGYIFQNIIEVSGCKFLYDVNFEKATFAGFATFRGATFIGYVIFNNVTFADYASFERVIFTDNPLFYRTKFTCGVHFGGAQFKNGAHFFRAVFMGSTYFSNARLSKYVYFRESTFSSEVNFNQAIFTGEANFEAVIFDEPVYFVRVVFRNKTRFCYANFNGETDFENAEFTNVGHFEGAKFNAPTSKIPSFRGVNIGSTRLDFSPYLSGDAEDAVFKINYIDEESIKETIINIQFLKHLSEQHGQVDQALNFNAMELRAKRLQVIEQLKVKDKNWLEGSFKCAYSGKWWASCPTTWLYDKVSDFGRSFMRPLVGFVAIYCIAFSFAYCCAGVNNPQNCHDKQGREVWHVMLCDTNSNLADEAKLELNNADAKLPLNGYEAAFEYANYHATGLVDFTGDSKLKDAITQRVFGVSVKPWWARLIGALLSIINTALLFLIALGLRNSYRLK